MESAPALRDLRSEKPLVLPNALKLRVSGSSTTTRLVPSVGSSRGLNIVCHKASKGLESQSLTSSSANFRTARSRAATLGRARRTVINLSVTSNVGVHQGLNDAINFAYLSGILTVCSAGNSNGGVSSYVFEILFELISWDSTRSMRLCADYRAIADPRLQQKPSFRSRSGSCRRSRYAEQTA